jgi:hypothetical protein
LQNQANTQIKQPADRVASGDNDIDANGYWTVTMPGIVWPHLPLPCQSPGETRSDLGEQPYDQLLSVNGTLQQTMNSNGIDYLPCALNQANDKNRCRDPQDANWASMLLFGRWYWEGYLWGAEQSGPMLDSIDATYDYGFQRLKNNLPNIPGGYPGYSTGYNAGYGRSGCGAQYRSEAVRITVHVG